MDNYILRHSVMMEPEYIPITNAQTNFELEMAQKIVCTVYGITYLVADLRDVLDVGLDVVVVDHEEGGVTQDAHRDEEVHERVQHDPAGHVLHPAPPPVVRVGAHEVTATTAAAVAVVTTRHVLLVLWVVFLERN